MRDKRNKLLPAHFIHKIWFSRYVSPWNQLFKLLIFQVMNEKIFISLILWWKFAFLICKCVIFFSEHNKYGKMLKISSKMQDFIVFPQIYGMSMVSLKTPRKKPLFVLPALQISPADKSPIHWAFESSFCTIFKFIWSLLLFFMNIFSQI